MSSPPCEGNATNLESSDMMEKVKGSMGGTPVASEEDVQPEKTDDDDVDLVFKLDMED